MYIFRCILCCLLYSLSIPLMAQEEVRPLPKTDTEIKKYLEDGKRTGATNSISLNLVNAWYEVDVMYERKLSDFYSLAGNVRVSTWDVFDIVSQDVEGYEYEHEGKWKGSFGAGVRLKYNRHHTIMYGRWYSFLGLQTRTFRYTTANVYLNELMLGTGYKKLFAKKFTIEPAISISGAHFNQKYTSYSLNAGKKINFISYTSSFELRIGYIW